MSIINEALKKAGKEKSSLEPVAALGSARPAPMKEPFNWGPLFVIFVLVLITAPIVAPAFSVPFRRTELPTVTPASEKTDRKEQFAVEEVPLFQPAAFPFTQPPLLTLSGIVYSPDDAYCIINDKIVKPGESVQEAKLITITQNQVVLDFKGQKIKLFVS